MDLIDDKLISNEGILKTDLKVKIGGSNSNRSVPNINFNRWNDEYFLNINAKDITPLIDKKETPNIDGKIKISSQNRDDIYWINADGNLQYSILLTKKPKSNVITLEIQCSSEFIFLHQPELTQQEINDGDHRPENIINSYAVYINNKSKINNKYGVGKFCHIERSWVRGADGKKIWCDQSINKISDGLFEWKIIVPQNIINNQENYPLEKDGTIGYATAGASYRDFLRGYLNAVIHNTFNTMSEDGIASQIAFYSIGSAIGGPWAIKFAIYDQSAGAPNSPVDFTLESTTHNATDQWLIFDCQIGATLSNGSTYYPTEWHNHSYSVWQFGYDSADAGVNDVHYNVALAYTNSSQLSDWADPFGTPSISAYRIISAYINYTTGGSGGETPQKRRYRMIL